MQYIPAVRNISINHPFQSLPSRQLKKKRFPTWENHYIPKVGFYSKIRYEKRGHPFG
jgi:hypothetical protein